MANEIGGEGRGVKNTTRKKFCIAGGGLVFGCAVLAANHADV